MLYAVYYRGKREGQKRVRRFGEGKGREGKEREGKETTDHFEDAGSDESIILKWIFKKYDGWRRRDRSGSGQG